MLSTNELQNQLSDFIESPLSSEQYFSRFTDGSRDILRGYIEEVGDISRANIDGLVSYQNQAIQTMSLGASKYLGILKNIGANLLLVVGSQLAFKVIDSTIEYLSFTPQHKAKIAKLAEDIQNTFNDALEKNKNNQTSVLEMADEFNKLAAGVSRTGENVSLTNEQYNTYRSYVERLISINPSLVEGINAQGEAFINNKEAIDKTSESLREQQRLLYANFFNGEDNRNTLEKLLDDREELLEKKRQTFMSTAAYSVGGEGLNGGVSFETDSAQYQLQFVEYYLNKLKNDYPKVNKMIDEIIQEYNIGDQAIVDNAEQYARNMLAARGKILSALEDGGLNTEQGYIDLQNTFYNIEDIMSNFDGVDIEGQSKLFDEYVDKWAKSSKDYWRLTDIQTKLVDRYVQNYGFADRFANDGSNQDEIENRMRKDVDKFIDFVGRLSQDSQSRMTEILNIDSSKLSYDDYQKLINDKIKEIVELDPNYDNNLFSVEDLKVVLGISFETDDGQIKNSYEDMLQNVVNRFGAKANFSTLKTFLNLIRGRRLKIS